MELTDIFFLNEIQIEHDRRNEKDGDMHNGCKSTNNKQIIDHNII